METAAVVADDGAADPAAVAQEHALQCHDHCKGAGQTSLLSFSTGAHAHETPLPVTLAQFNMGTLIRPPR